MNYTDPDMHKLLEAYLGRPVASDGYVMMSDEDLKGFRAYVMNCHRLIYGGDYETEMAGALLRAMPDVQSALPDFSAAQQRRDSPVSEYENEKAEIVAYLWLNWVDEHREDWCELSVRGVATEIAGSAAALILQAGVCGPEIRRGRWSKPAPAVASFPAEQASPHRHANYIYHLIDLAKAGRHEEVSNYVLDLWDPDLKNPENPYAHRHTDA